MSLIVFQTSTFDFLKNLRIKLLRHFIKCFRAFREKFFKDYIKVVKVQILNTFFCFDAVKFMFDEGCFPLAKINVSLQGERLWCFMFFKYILFYINQFFHDKFSFIFHTTLKTQSLPYSDIQYNIHLYMWFLLKHNI